MRRRTMVSALLGASASALAGCISGDDDANDTGTDDESTNTEDNGDDAEPPDVEGSDAFQEFVLTVDSEFGVGHRSIISAEEDGSEWILDYNRNTLERSDSVRMDAQSIGQFYLEYLPDDDEHERLTGTGHNADLDDIPIASYTIEREWVESYLDGEIDEDEYDRRIWDAVE